VAPRERVGMFIVTVRSTDIADALWFARIASTLDVTQICPRAVHGLSPTVAIEDLVSSMTQWLAEFETDERRTP
jgi:hypothetical protein